MNKDNAPETYTQQDNFLAFFKPADAWTTIFLFVAVILMAFGVGAKSLNVIYPFGAFVVSLKLYFRHHFLYAGFVWWLFLLTPLVRRIADFRAGTFSDPSPMLLAPYVAILICVYTLYLNLSKSKEQGSIPFILAISGVVYGYLVGLINSNNFVSVTVAFLEWISPILFAYHLYINWHRYPAYCRNLQKVFLWGVLIMGIYGVYQYLVAPEWDRFWLANAPNVLSSMGKPEPLGIRVWSTMNASGTFAVFMAAGLLILFSCQSFLVLPAAGFGALSFLLSVVRTGWLSWFFGMIFISANIKPKQQFKLVLTILVLAALVIPLATMEPFGSTITKRLETLSDISNDGSFQERQGLYNILFNDALQSYIGRGIGVGTGYDSAILVMLFDLGWVGSIPYVGSLIALLILIFKSPKTTRDIFASIIHAMILQSIFYLFAGASMKGASGMLLWSSLSLALSGRNYYYKSNLLQNSADSDLRYKTFIDAEKS
ncbi:O-antigen ligase domain-containing protein [Pseudanabaena sp. UWO311]|uniref:O-antigen ligase domain-containing protein n=1 Tax=Pseudanabaena sp. UWO311 TaxID=2487337 RepID=UPI00115A5042|nr:O-antigen ligase domain-containing protein [Pseudanabaena sp. UWO311]TYQ26958.1 O-antigen ligase domain-containing protein [Pseudanabaena sp. UWO311]